MLFQRVNNEGIRVFIVDSICHSARGGERERPAKTQRAQAREREEGRNLRDGDGPPAEGKGRKGGRATRARLRAARPASRIAYARACICKRAAWSDETTADRLHEAPRQKGGIRTRGRARAGRRDGEGGRERTAGGGRRV